MHLERSNLTEPQQQQQKVDFGAPWLWIGCLKFLQVEKKKFTTSNLIPKSIFFWKSVEKPTALIYCRETYAAPHCFPNWTKKWHFLKNYHLVQKKVVIGYFPPFRSSKPKNLHIFIWTVQTESPNFPVFGLFLKPCAF